MKRLVGRPGLDSAGGSDPWPTAEKVGWAVVGHRPLAGDGASSCAGHTSNPGPPDEKSTPCIIEVIENQNATACLNLTLALS